MILPILLIAQNKPAAQNRPLVFRNVTLIGMTSEQPKPNITVVISGNRISQIGRNIKIPKNAEVIDGSGKFLIPGLWDMHVHTLYEGRPEMFFPMFIANGVTGVRDMGSTFTLEEIKRIRREIDEGKILGPRFGAVNGKVLDGVGTQVEPGVGVASAAEGRELVKTLKQQGADFIKVYNLLPRDVYTAIVDEAKRQQMPFVGHVPFSMSAAEVSDMGQKSIEHETDLFISCSRDEAIYREELRAQAKATAASNEARRRVEIKAVDTYDGQKAARLFARFVRNGTWQCPTLALRNSTTVADITELFDDSRMKYIPFSVRGNWDNIFNQRIVPMGNLEQRRKRFLKGIEVAGAMQRAGVKILAGTDTGWGNAYTFAGFSLHDELSLLVKSGFAPLEALKAATINPATFLGKEKEIGTIEKGKLADLVLLDANPLTDISNTRKINAVVVDGRYLSREVLDKMLSDIEAKAKMQ